MLLTEEFPLSSHCIWSLCTAPPAPPHQSMPARALGTLGALLIHLEHGSLGKGFGFLCFTPGRVLRTWLLGKLCGLQASFFPAAWMTLSLSAFVSFPLGAGDILYVFGDAEKLAGKPSLVHLFLWMACTLKVTCRTPACRGVFTHAIDTSYEVSPICASA